MGLQKPCVLLTGATGFLGKVVLEELLRQASIGQLPKHKIVVLIRNTAKLNAQERFKKLSQSKCFVNLPTDWTDCVEVVHGDLTSKCCHLSPEKYDELCRSVTHIIHCAASIDFNLPIHEAAISNISTCLNLLQFSEDCYHLRKMVFVSTAYVRPHRIGLLSEELVALPMPGEELYSSIMAGTITEKKLLLQTGHANTYTLTKCIAEHLVSNRCRNTPITILRPSIISAAWKYPFPAWLDSWAALGGYGALFGSGFLHCMEGHVDTIFDLVPVDVVANDAIREVDIQNYESDQITDAPPAYWHGTQIRHSTVGIRHQMTAQLMIDIGTSYFTENVVVRKPYWTYLGPKGFSLSWYRAVTESIPLELANWFYWLTGNRSMRKRIGLVKRGLHTVAQCFPYFASHTFDFASSRELDADFSGSKYMTIICMGIRRHLLLGDK